MVIWKYELEIVDAQFLEVPKGARVLSVANQNGNLCMWAMVDPSKEMGSYLIEIFGTGNPVPVEMGVNRLYIGTVLIDQFVWHVFYSF